MSTSKMCVCMYQVVLFSSYGGKVSCLLLREGFLCVKWSAWNSCCLGSVVTREITRGECCTALQLLRFPQQRPSATIQVYFPKGRCKSHSLHLLWQQSLTFFFMQTRICSVRINTAAELPSPLLFCSYVETKCEMTAREVWQVKKTSSRDLGGISQSWQYLFHFLASFFPPLFFFYPLPLLQVKSCESFIAEADFCYSACWKKSWLSRTKRCVTNLIQ